jgi:hypothetical protein
MKKEQMQAPTMLDLDFSNPEKAAAILRGDDIRTKGDLVDWISARFTMAPERHTRETKP